MTQPESLDVLQLTATIEAGTEDLAIAATLRSDNTAAVEAADAAVQDAAATLAAAQEEYDYEVNRRRAAVRRVDGYPEALQSIATTIAHGIAADENVNGLLRALAVNVYTQTPNADTTPETYATSLRQAMGHLATIHSALAKPTPVLVSSGDDFIAATGVTNANFTHTLPSPPEAGSRAQTSPYAEIELVLPDAKTGGVFGSNTIVSTVDTESGGIEIFGITSGHRRLHDDSPEVWLGQLADNTGPLVIGLEAIEEKLLSLEPHERYIAKATLLAAGVETAAEVDEAIRIEAETLLASELMQRALTPEHLEAQRADSSSAIEDHDIRISCATLELSAQQLLEKALTVAAFYEQTVHPERIEEASRIASAPQKLRLIIKNIFGEDALSDAALPPAKFKSGPQLARLPIE